MAASKKHRRGPCRDCDGQGVVEDRICTVCAGWGVLPIPQSGKRRATRPGAVPHVSPTKQTTKLGVLPVGGRQGLERWRHAPRERIPRPVEVSFLSPEQLAELRRQAGLDR
ncbi:MAG: hypothetical protein ACTHNU_15770 [Gaiellales bacterium]